MQTLTNRRFGRTLIRGCTVILIGMVIFGFTGRYFAAGDSIALLRPQVGVLLVGLAVILVIIRSGILALAALISAGVAIGSVALEFTSPDPQCNGTCLTLYQKNLLVKAWPRYSLADDIIDSGADIVTLQEVSAHNREYMANMYDHYPRKIHCQFRPHQDIAVLTHLPVVDGSEFCISDLGLAGLQVIASDGRKVWAVSVHLHWPFPFEGSQQSHEIAERLAELDGPVLIGGDFNMVPWGTSVKRIGASVGNKNFGTAENTHSLGSRWLPLSIDNVLLPRGTTGTIELRPYMGSDHLGKFARFQLP